MATLQPTPMLRHGARTLGMLTAGVGVAVAVASWLSTTGQPLVERLWPLALLGLLYGSVALPRSVRLPWSVRAGLPPVVFVSLYVAVPVPVTLMLAIACLATQVARMRGRRTLAIWFLHAAAMEIGWGLAAIGQSPLALGLAARVGLAGAAVGMHLIVHLARDNARLLAVVEAVHHGDRSIGRAQTQAAVYAATEAALRRLSPPGHEAAGGVWEVANEGLRRDPEGAGEPALVSLEDLPVPARDAALSGEPFLLDGDALSLFGGADRRRTAIALPIRRADRTVAYLIIEQVEGFDALEDAFGRIAAAASVALDRIALRELVDGVFETAPDPILVIARDGTILQSSAAVARTLGYESADLVGRPFTDLTFTEDREWVERLLLPEHPAGMRLDCRLRTQDGHWRDVELGVSPLPASAHSPGRVVTIRDVTERNALEHEISFRALHDPLTGLANRELFTERVEAELDRARRQGTRLAVISIDIDDFKTVNDSLGHTAGDELLITVAQRLEGLIRDGDIAARLGGDEFAVILSSIGGTQEAILVAQRVLEALRQLTPLANEDVIARGSIGLAVAHAGQTTTEELLRDADLAMHAAKAAGKNRIEVFHKSMRASATDKLRLRLDMNAAFDRDEFRLLYQPIVSLDDGNVIGVEALIRWLHPERGLLPPADFLPLAEEDGLIILMGHWVIAEACRQLAAWDAEGHPPVRMSVNISGRELADPLLEHVVRSAITETGIDPSRLTLEVTEHTLVDDLEHAASTLASLRSLGVAVAVDDFGVGHSSLRYLYELPLDILKMDRSFIGELRDPGKGGAITHTILTLASRLGMTVVAEGVERSEDADILRGWGCQLAQGFLYGPPLPADEIPLMAAQAETTPLTEPLTAGQATRNGRQRPTRRSSEPSRTLS
jgi:diguanylate cyclase (GGDEF)-like protein/PAS domain S-box-containing protein